MFKIIFDDGAEFKFDKKDAALLALEIATYDVLGKSETDKFKVLRDIHEVTSHSEYPEVRNKLMKIATKIYVSCHLGDI